VPTATSGCGGPDELYNALKDRRVVPRQRGEKKKQQRRVRFSSAMLKDRQTAYSACVQMLQHRKKCCKENCTSKFTAHLVQSIRNRYWTLSSKEKDAYLRALIAQQAGGEAYIKTPYLLSAVAVCGTALPRIIGIGNKRFQAEIRYVRHGDVSAVVKKNAWTDKRWRGTKMVAIISWIRGYTGLRCTTGDWMPDKRELHLAYQQLTQLYGLYRADMLIANYTSENIATYQHFNRIFRRHFPHVKVHKRKEFSKCDRCTELYEKLFAETDRVHLKVIRKDLEDHLDLVLRAKQKYWDHIRKAINNPTMYMSTILDGMDSMKSVIPHWIRMPKTFEGKFVMQMHIEGVLQHGHEPPSAAYLSPPGVKKGACLAIETLTRSLIFQKRRHGYVPPVWYIQADNATGEFKNTVCMTWLALLVQLGIFRKVLLLL
jgi:hypothetical protein